MSYKFELSTVVTLIEWLAKYDETKPHESPDAFLKEHFCDQKLFVDKTLEKEIFENICRHRNLVELLLKSASLEINAHHVVHLFLMIFFMSKSTRATIFESMKLSLSEDVGRTLIGLIDEEQFAKVVQQGGGGDLDQEAIRRNLVEIQDLRVKMRKSIMNICNPNQGEASSLTPSTSCSRSTRPHIKFRATNASDESENKLDKILMNLPKRKSKKPKVLRCKDNTASVLRAGALVHHVIKRNDAMIEGIVAGSSDPLVIGLKQKHQRERASIDRILETERKHLLGLISQQEARIARMESLKSNQEAADEMKKEHQKLLEFIKREQEQQIVKSKHIIRKTHLGRLMTRKNLFDVATKKKLSADDVRKLNEKLQQEVNEAREKELLYKAKLIQKIRSLEKKPKSNVTDYHKMSILELKQSIINLRQKLDQETQARKKKIQQEHERKKQLVEHATTLIGIRHKLRESKTDEIKRAIKPTPDLVALREKLVQMRRMTSGTP